MSENAVHMGCGAVAGRLRVDDQDSAAGPSEHLCGLEPGDTAADDDGVVKCHAPKLMKKIFNSKGACRWRRVSADQCSSHKDLGDQVKGQP